MQKYGLIGYPLKHSFSIGFFNEKFKSEGIDAEYVNFEIPEINDFMEVIEENPNLCGLNVLSRISIKLSLTAMALPGKKADTQKNRF